MHIAFLTPEYPHTTSTPSGGLGTSIKNLSQALVLEGVEVSIIIYGQKKNLTFTEDKTHFYLVRQKNYKFGGWFFYRKYLQGFLNKLSAEKNIDIIEAADWTGITAFMNLNRPLVIRLHGSDAYFCELEGRKQKWKNRWFEKKALSNADKIISVSEFTGIKTKEIFDLKKAFDVIPNGVNIENFHPEHDTIYHNQIFYFGSLIRKKGFLELASIFNKIVAEKPDAKLLIAGKDVKDIKENISTYEIFYARLSDESKDRVNFLGKTSYDEVKKNLAESAVVVLPSFAEAFPMTWLEAMAMEKALVTSNIGWAKELMDEGKTGYTIHPEEHDKFALKVLKLLKNINLREKFGKEARKKVIANFSSSLIAEKNIEVYRNMLKSPES